VHTRRDRWINRLGDVQRRGGNRRFGASSRAGRC
jgi:hypothetical protein